MSPIANVTLDAASFQQVQPEVAGFIASLRAGSTRPETWQPSPLPATEGLAMPSQVNFVGKAVNLFDAGYQRDGSILAILNYLNSTYLWEQVRVQGGAYGGFAVFDPHSGGFSLLSYRDPNLLKTLAVYDRTAGFLREMKDLPAEELTRSIIGAIGELDAYQLPDAKGYTALVRHLLGIDDAWRQAYREQLLDASAADFTALAEFVQTVETDGHVAVLGSPDALQEANRQRSDFLTIKQVL